MKSITLCAAAAVAVLAVSVSGCSKKTAADDTVKVGVLHSLSGTMAISETSVRDAEMLAINEINASGGVLGKKIVAVEEDGASDPQIFAEKARKLLSNDKVATIFGCWTSASRKAVKPVVEELHGLLWYPVQYEGMEASPDIMYMGAAPNQQAVPAVDFCAEKFGKNMFLVGSDYVFPRTANKIIKEQLTHLGGTVAGEEYTPLGHTDYATIVSKIQAAKPDCIINTLNGDSNVAFFKQLTDAGITADKIPVMSFSIAEEEVGGVGVDNLKGHYVAWNYYETTKTPENDAFVKAYKAAYGDKRVTDDPIEAGYIGVHIWALAATKAGSFDVDKVREAAKGMTFAAPEGTVTVDGDNQHLYKPVRIGKVNEQGLIDEVWATNGAIKPDPYLSTYDWFKE